MRFGSAGVVLCLSFTMTGCAAIVNGVNQPIAVETRMNGDPFPGAACKLSSNKGTWFVTTPGSLVVHRGYQDLLVECEKDGAPPTIASIASSTKAMAFGNILFGGAIGVGVDVGTGAAYDYPALISIEMGRAGSVKPTGVSVSPASRPTTIAEEQAAAGATAVAATPTATGARALRYHVGAEGFARDRSCTSTPKAVLVAYSGSTETYMIECSSGQPLVARCDYASCREMK